MHTDRIEFTDSESDTAVVLVLRDDNIWERIDFVDWSRPSKRRETYRKKIENDKLTETIQSLVKQP